MGYFIMSVGAVAKFMSVFHNIPVQNTSIHINNGTRKAFLFCLLQNLSYRWLRRWLHSIFTNNSIFNKQ